MGKLRFLNLVKPVMFLIPEIKAPVKQVNPFSNLRLTREINLFGLLLPYLSILSAVKSLYTVSTKLAELTLSTG
jgi:hypothetical protein